MKPFDDTLAAVGFLGIGLLVATVFPVPPQSHDVVLAFGSALAGFVAKGVKDAAFPSDPPTPPTEGPNA